MRFRYFLALLLILMPLIFSSCSLIPPSTEEILNNAISELSQQPGKWQQVLNNTLTQLGDTAKDVSDHVKGLIDDTVDKTGVEARCDLDFVGQRVIDNLTYIRDAILKKQQVVQKAPGICHIEPDTLSLAWDTVAHKWVPKTQERIYGFDFHTLNPPTINLYDQNDRLIRHSTATIVRSTAYEVIVDFSTEDFNTVIAPGYHFYLVWSSTVEKNGILIQKIPVEQRTCGFSSEMAFGSQISCQKTVNAAARAGYDLIYTVFEPNVTQGRTPYNMITFEAGDLVQVNAYGCVQTGGSGLTWKRYVDPSGANSDHLYHGLINLPGATNGLTRIQNIIGRQLIVSGGSLDLGYEDDGYSDNGYYAHDNGTDNQCSTGEHATVVITIYPPLIV